MEKIPYASAGRFMYAQVCIRPNIAFAMGVLGRFQKNPDSDYTGCEDTRRSTSAYMFLLARGAASWRSIKQPKTASSTMEAEVVACYEAISQASWLSRCTHIEIKYFVIKEDVRDHKVLIKHIDTNGNIADPFTKGLAPKVFVDHVRNKV
ncbi:secreted RxLR effector protein 161-like [Macadamia integrifolia]|uniref:secreted RxLR effector protein 161-like n=1 Tax=Macadamia integrifolia TaxID=60698 RepID=UPI001C4F6DE9|nr:secreted RxLR effector protein 161-like [Macadamia integrifolia]